ncbi:MAG: WYL domain-containing protein [Proteobacteria bacterium]|nr:WYL domain-containing protein [Pseudomonadota bacterium]
MKKSDRTFLLDQILKQRKTPVPKDYLIERLECSQATFYRIVDELKTTYQAPVERNEHGYFYAQDVNLDLPGLRLNSEEISGLLIAANLLEDIQSDSLKKPLERLLENIDKVLGEEGINNRRTIQILRALSRQPDKKIFTTIMSALQSAKKLNIHYQDRRSQKITKRLISPQRLTSYKNAWYLDAWCHLRSAIRSFSLEQIIDLKIDAEKSKIIHDKQLKNHFSSSYGIFSGKANKTAKILFNADISPWASKEQWHSKQKIETLKNGQVIINIPYKYDAELIMDILRYGASATVLEPTELSKKIKKILQETLNNYKQP